MGNANPTASLAEGATITVVVVSSPGKSKILERCVQLPLGATLADAVRRSGLLDAKLTPAQWPVCGIWGRVVESSQMLANHDRVELYRPLTVDPKVARRERFARQGARSAGLFARQRTGGR